MRYIVTFFYFRVIFENLSTVFLVVSEWNQRSPLSHNESVWIESVNIKRDPL